MNNGMPGYVARRVQSGLNDRFKPVNGSTVLILGLAYKKNSNDARETPSTELITALLGMGASVRAYDAHVDRYELDDMITRVEELTDAELATSDAVVLVTEHDDVDYDRVVEHAGYVFDARHHLEASDSVEQL